MQDVIVEVVDIEDGEVVARDYGSQVIADNEGDETVSDAVEAIRQGVGDQIVGFYILRLAPDLDPIVPKHTYS